MKIVAVVITAICLLLMGPQSATTQVGEIRYGGVLVRVDAPRAVHDYFGIIPKRIAHAEDEVRRVTEELKAARIDIARNGSSREKGEHLRTLQQNLKAAQDQLAAIRSPAYRPHVNDGHHIKENGTVRLLPGARTMKVQSADSVVINLAGVAGYSFPFLLSGIDTKNMQDDQYISFPFPLVDDGVADLSAPMFKGDQIVSRVTKLKFFRENVEEYVMK